MSRNIFVSKKTTKQQNKDKLARTNNYTMRESGNGNVRVAFMHSLRGGAERLGGGGAAASVVGGKEEGEGRQVWRQQ